MRLSKISMIFDSNIFIYSALDHLKFGEKSTKLISKVESREIEGYIPTIVLNETLHRLMIAESIRERKAKNVKDALFILKNDREIIPKLKICWSEINKIFEMNFIILKEKTNTFLNSIEISKRYSLLARYAYITSFAKDYGIENIATFDRDFERVDFLKVWKS